MGFPEREYEVCPCVCSCGRDEGQGVIFCGFLDGFHDGFVLEVGGCFVIVIGERRGC